MKYAAPAVLAVGIVGIGVAGTPRLLSRFAFFEIRQVEVVGVRYLTPDRILDAARIEESNNLFRDLDEVEERVRNIPGVTEVELERKLPGTLRIAVAERMPVAFVIGQGSLIPLDENAHPLPYDPTVGPLDLPVIQRPDTVLTGVLAQVRATAPALFDDIDDAERIGGDGVVLNMGPRRLLLRAATTRSEVLSMLAVRRRILDSNGDFAELDGRFDGLVIARGETS